MRPFLRNKLNNLCDCMRKYAKICGKYASLYNQMQTNKAYFHIIYYITNFNLIKLQVLKINHKYRVIKSYKKQNWKSYNKFNLPFKVKKQKKINRS